MGNRLVLRYLYKEDSINQNAAKEKNRWEASEK